MPDDDAVGGSESLGRRAYRVLRQAVRDGVIQPERYYSESELAELLGVSRTPVREALKGLERDGVLSSARHRGYRLRTYDDADIEEMLGLRQVLESFAVERLVAVLTEDDVETLGVTIERQRQPDGLDQFFGLDEEFHLLLADLAGLQTTRNMLAALRGAMAIVIAGVEISEERTHIAIEEHGQIVRAIARRDTAGAQALLAAHIENATRGLLQARQLRRARRDRLRLALQHA